MTPGSRARLRPAIRAPQEPPSPVNEPPGALPQTVPSAFFTVPGDPMPQPRPRVYRNGGVSEDPRATRHKQATIMAARLARAGCHAGEVELSVVYHRATARRVDLDNLLKLTQDALTGVTWADDSQIVAVHARKVIDRANPRTEVYVRTWSTGRPDAWDNASWLRKWEE